MRSVASFVKIRMVTGITEVTQDPEKAGRILPEHIVIYGATNFAA